MYSIASAICKQAVEPDYVPPIHVPIGDLLLHVMAASLSMNRAPLAYGKVFWTGC